MLNELTSQKMLFCTGFEKYLYYLNLDEISPDFHWPQFTSQKPNFDFENVVDPFFKYF